MSLKTIQKRIKHLVVLGILSTGAVLAGTGCDLDNPATRPLLPASGSGQISLGTGDQEILSDHHPVNGFNFLMWM